MTHLKKVHQEPFLVETNSRIRWKKKTLKRPKETIAIKISNNHLKKQRQQSIVIEIQGINQQKAMEFQLRIGDSKEQKIINWLEDTGVEKMPSFPYL